jgi:NAD(P)-dependent dehydrogenase (short-subunit alcohol dehydrogenase family)
MQAVICAEWPTPPRLWLATRGAQPIGDALSETALAQSPVWGLGRVFALEHPDLWGGLIDLPPAGETSVLSDASLLFDEIQQPDGEDQIALRGDRRHVARLTRSRVESMTVKPLAIAPDATYLITGGLGSLGLQLARWLVDHGARRLVLTGRSGLPDRSQWETIAADTDFGRRIAAVKAIEALGAAITVAQVDVADEAGMSALFAELKRTHPPVRGILHAAGVAATHALADLSLDALHAVLRPKVIGTLVLHRLTQLIEPLDFFILFSSGAAVWGSQGLGHYAAANQFMDAFAHHRRRHGLPALSVNWGWWAGDGMATTAQARLFTQVGLNVMPPDQALSALVYLLRTDAIQAVVASIDWAAFKPIYESKRPRPLLKRIEAPAQTNDAGATGERRTFTDQLRSAAPDQRWQMLLAHVRDQVSRVLGFASGEALDTRQGFFRMGMDSLTTVQLRRHLEVSLGCALPTTVAFEYPTVEALTRFLMDDVLALDVPDQMEDGSDRAEQARAQLDMLSNEELVARFDDELAAINRLTEIS